MAAASTGLPADQSDDTRLTNGIRTTARRAERDRDAVTLRMDVEDLEPVEAITQRGVRAILLDRRGRTLVAERQGRPLRGVDAGQVGLVGRRHRRAVRGSDQRPAVQQALDKFTTTVTGRPAISA